MARRRTPHDLYYTYDLQREATSLERPPLLGDHLSWETILAIKNVWSRIQVQLYQRYANRELSRDKHCTTPGSNATPRSDVSEMNSNCHAFWRFLCVVCEAVSLIHTKVPVYNALAWTHKCTSVLICSSYFAKSPAANIWDNRTCSEWRFARVASISVIRKLSARFVIHNFVNSS